MSSVTDTSQQSVDKRKKKTVTLQSFSSLSAANLSVALGQFYQQLAKPLQYSVFLEGMPPVKNTVGETSKTNHWSLIGLVPKQVLKLQNNTLTQSEVVDNIEQPVKTVLINNATELFPQLRQLLTSCQQYQQPDDGELLPFVGGFAGLLGYGFTRWCDSALTNVQSDPKQPDLLWCEFHHYILINRQSHQCYWLVDDEDKLKEYQQVLQQCINTAGSDCERFQLIMPQLKNYPEDYCQTFQQSFSQPQFKTAVERLLNQIQEGNVYQANLSMQFKKQLTVCPALTYQLLSAINPSPFSGAFYWPQGMVLSNSPERLVKVERLGNIETRPIAGTRGRSANSTEDAEIAKKLQTNIKEQAEHLMLVDLLRNDVGRVSKIGSVQVDELMVVERYSHVMHLVSNVIGQCDGTRYDSFDVLRSVFPGGTITGCPKIRCINILESEEPVHRVFYTGSLGYIDAATGAMDWNILIRSLFLSNEQPYSDSGLRYNATVHVGAGIVADSVGSHEYRECLRKASALLGVLYYVESTYGKTPHH